MKSKELLDRSLSTTEELISDAGLRGSSAKPIERNSVLMAMYGANVGQLGWLKVTATVNQAVCAMETDPEHTDGRWLFYSLMHWRPALTAKAHGAAQQNLSQGLIREFEVSTPPLSIQRKIAAVLAAYDELIENNLRRIEILEEMAQAVYREWFVNFRFPDHEDVAMVDSPLGPIPEGWEVGMLAAIVENVRASTQAGSHLDELPYVPIDCIAPRSITLRESKLGTEAKSSLILFEQGDILFGAMRPYFHKVALAPGTGVTRTTCFVLRPTRRTWQCFALMTMFRDETIAYATSHSRGTTIPYAAWDGSLAAMTICIPSDGLLERFDTEVMPMVDLAANLARQNANLCATRDLLLPRLVSGEIDVSDLDIDTGWLAS